MKRTQIKQQLKNISNEGLELLETIQKSNHFSELADTAEESGLLYIAGVIGKTSKILKLPFLDEKRKDHLLIPSELCEPNRLRAVKIGSREFFKDLAEVYIQNDCGCKEGYHRENLLAPLKGYEKMLEYSHIIWLIKAYGCGKAFQKELCLGLYNSDSKDSSSSTKEIEMLERAKNHFESSWWNSTWEQRTLALSEIAQKTLGIPKGLEHRLHIIPVINSGTSYSE